MIETDPFTPKLNGITTRWSMLRQAHTGSAESATDARRWLVLRYAPAIKAYVRAITRDEEQTEELTQDAVLRLLKGDFAGADPERGRFRDLLKTAVRNMVRNDWARRKRRKPVNYDLAACADGSHPDDPDPWLEGWRGRVLDLAWQRLRQFQQQASGRTAYTVLKARFDFPDDTSEQLAERIRGLTGQDFRPDALRQQLRRARLRFAEYLVEEIAEGLDNPSPARVEDELIALGLHHLVSEVLPDDWRASPRIALDNSA